MNKILRFIRSAGPGAVVDNGTGFPTLTEILGR